MGPTLVSMAVALSLSGGAPMLETAAGGAPQVTEQNVWQRMEEHGRVTVEDIRIHATTVFRALDADGNGTVSRTELLNERLPDDLGRVSHDPELRRRLFEKLNSDGGGVTPTEWRNALDKDLGVADLDEDGTITLTELARTDASSAFLNWLGF